MSGRIEDKNLGLSDFLKRFSLFIFREREREGEGEGEKHQCVVASRTSPTGDLDCNPAMSPGWELNQQPFASQSDAQSTEPHQPGLRCIFCSVIMIKKNEEKRKKEKLLYIALWQKHLPHQFLPIKITCFGSSKGFFTFRGKRGNQLML